MTRIATMASNETLLGYLQKSQARLQTLQTQVSTEKRAQSYAGIALDAPAVIGLEAERTHLAQFRRLGEMLQTRLTATATGVDDLRRTVQDFRNQLVGAAATDPLDAAHVTEIQEAAFRALKAMEATLDSDFNGRYLFAGGRTTTPPVSLGVETLAEFQQVWDGAGVIYPPTRDAHVGSRAVLPPAVSGGLSFAAGPPATVRAANPVFANVPVGATIDISGSGSHDGAYTVVARNAGNDTLTLAGTLTTPGGAAFTVTRAVAGGAEAAATLSVRGWARGDDLAETHRVDAMRSLTLAVSAIDPGFEKAIRAMGIVAQGGLAAAAGRLTDSLALINDALDAGTGTGLPYGNEAAGSIDRLAQQVGFHQVLLKEAGEAQGAAIALIEGRVAALENIDKTEAIARMLDESNALEASYQALARIRQLNLAQFLS